MANELACLNCGMGFTPTCHITRQKCSNSECRVRYNNAKRYCTDTPVNECPECGTPIQQSGEAGRWHQCEKEEACVPMKKSTVPPALLPGSGIVSASLLAQIMHSKYVLALPLYRQEQELCRLGLPVSRQTMSNWVLTAGERWLLPVYHVLHKELLANEILHADETTLMVLREPERQALADELGEDGIRELAQRYAEAYEGCYDGAELDAYIGEICADAYAGMDRLPEAKTQIIQKAAKRAQGAQQAAEENGGTRGPPEKYSVVTLPDGKKFVKADRLVLFGNDPREWRVQLEDYINGKIRRGEDVTLIGADGDELVLTATSAGKLSSPYTNDGRTMSDAAYELKGNAAAHIDELVSISNRKGTVKTDRAGRHGAMASDGWAYRTAYFEDFNGKYYQLTISAARNASGSMVYNIGNMKEEASPKVKGSSAGNGNGPRGFASSDTSIRSAEQKSQEKFSAADDAVAEDGAEGTTAFTLDSIPKKAQDYLRRVRGQTAAAIQQTLSMPFAARQEVLKPAIEEMMNEYLQTGRISQETVDRNFEESYRRGVKRPTVRVRWEFSDTP